MPTQFLLAYRYLITLHSSDRHAALRSMSIICFIAIALAASSLALTIAIINGFQQATLQALQGMHADIIMQARNNDHIDTDLLAPVLIKEFPAITAHAAHDIQQGLLNNSDSGEQPQLVTIKGIVPEQEAQTTNLEKTIINKKKLTTLLGNNTILIGYKLAHELDVQEGDLLDLFVVTDQSLTNQHLSFDKIPVRVGGTVKTGIEEYDAALVICHLSFLQEIAPTTGTHYVTLRTGPTTCIPALIASLKKRTGLMVYTWQDLYPAVVAALALEKYAMWLIMTLVIILASITVFALISMIIAHKQRDSALLYALGFSSVQVNTVFMLMGLTIGCCATLTGFFIAYTATFLMQTFPLTLPDAYYIQTIPVVLHPTTLFYLFCFIMFLITIATLMACRKNNKLSVATLLKING